jgi:hypothetical protein
LAVCTCFVVAMDTSVGRISSPCVPSKLVSPGFPHRRCPNADRGAFPTLSGGYE